MIGPFLRGALLGLLAGLLLVAAILGLHRNPLTFPAEELELTGEASHAGTAAAPVDATLVVHGDGIRRAAASGRFGELDLSWGWVNLLSQEVGPYRIHDLSTSGDVPRDAPLIVWTRSASATTDAPLAAQLAGAVEDGAIALIELPSEALAGLAGLEALGPPVAASGISFPGTSPLGATASLALGGIDVPFMVLAARAAGDAEVLLRIGEHAAAVRRRVGDGWVIALGFDLGRALTSLQQGTPRDDMTVENRYTDRLAPLVESSDLVASESLLDNAVPYADILEGLVAAWVEAVRPLPGWWGYPAGAPGAFLMTHDDEGIGDKARWMTEHEADLGIPSTSFFLPAEDRLSAAGLATMRDHGTEVGIHWARDGSGYWEQRFLGPVRWARRGRSLADQIAWLRSLDPEDAPVTAARSHYLVWSDDWAGSFRVMAAAGITIDSSYGLDTTCRGYMFGTGRPFRALDDNGLPLPILEVPHLGTEDLNGFDPAYLDRLLAESRDGYHQSITVLFHPNTPHWRPSVNLYRHWKRSYEAARAADHVALTLGELAAFETSRRGSPLHSVWDGDVLRVEGESRDADLRLRLPAAIGGRTLARVVAGGEMLPFRRFEPLGRGAVLVSTGSGPFEVEAVYRQGGAP